MTATMTAPATLAEHMEAMWRNETLGASEHSTAHRLAEHERDLAGVKAGRIAPRRIIGTGYREPKKVAVQWLTDRVAECRLTLATRGWSDAVNRGNAALAMRTGEAPSPSTYHCTCESWRGHGVPVDHELEERYRTEWDRGQPRL